MINQKMVRNVHADLPPEFLATPNPGLFPEPSSLIGTIGDQDPQIPEIHPILSGVFEKGEPV